MVAILKERNDVLRDDRMDTASESMAKCSFCGGEYRERKMVKTPLGPYCRRCWVDHYI